jgi:hypothetical protein
LVERATYETLTDSSHYPSRSQPRNEERGSGSGERILKTDEQ